MKKIILLPIIILVIQSALAQQGDFKTYISTARTSYTSGKLEDAHFSLQQAMLELDIIIGKEVLKLLPPKMDTLSVNTADDNVTGNISFVGATIHRSYGAKQRAEIEIINNSPMLATLNAFLNMPMGGLMKDENNKTVKVQGYKARLERQLNGEGQQPTYVLNVPLNTALVTFTVRETSENDILKLANTIPLQQVAKLVQ